jgi:glycosyltransferase involved in cell wall biosynthesis
MKVNKVVCLFASYAPSLINFRGDLISTLIAQGCDVVCLAPAVAPETADKINSLGASVFSVDLERTGINPFKDAIATLKLWRKLRQIRPDVFMPYTIKPVIYGSVAAYLAGVPHRVALITGLGFTFTEAEQEEHTLLKSAIKLLYKFGLRCATTVVVQNPDDRSLLIQQKMVAAHKLTVVDGSGVSLQRFARQPLPDTNIIKFLLIARLNRSKGIYEYAAAAAKLKQRFPKVECHLAGWIDDTPDSVATADLEQWITLGTIIYHGFQKDVRPLLKACHVFVLPSVYREGTPRTILEALATGRPIITTDNPGCRETVIEGKNGYLVPTQDSDVLADRMAQFVQEPQLIKTQGDAAYDLAVEKYDVKKVNRRMLSILNIEQADNHHA